MVGVQPLGAGRMWKFIRTLIGICALFLVCWAVATSATFHSCVEKNQSPNGDFAKSISQFRVEMGAYRDCTGQFIRENRDEVLATFTIVLAVSTMFLWLATRNLVQGADRTAKQQLRAYALLGECKIDASNPDDPKALLRFANFGQTPAKRLRVTVNAKTIWGQEIRTLPLTKPNYRSSVTLGGSRAETINSVQLSQCLTGAGIEAIRKGELELYIYGLVEYQDVFRQRQISEFKYMIGGQFGWPVDDRLIACDDGNEAT
jgi:hypothetical protein